MKYISLDSVVAAYVKNKTSTKSKFWGLLSILSATDKEVKPGESYPFSTAKVSSVLENIFNLTDEKRQYTSTDQWYVMLSRVWSEKAQEQMISGNSKPNAYSVAVWFLRNSVFDDNATREDVLKKFRQLINISKDDFETLFDVRAYDISFTHIKYTEEDLRNRIKGVLHDTTSYTNVNAEGTFIASNAGELSRAPFVQTMYASQKSTECLLLTQFDFTSEYALDAAKYEDLVPHAQTVSDVHVTYDATPKYTPYQKEDFLLEVFMDEAQYDAIVELLNRKKNIILQGAPGVGKTFAAKRLAYSMLGCKDESKVEFIQFHQSYAYEDFVLGYKPTETGFTIEEGPFYKFCKKAEANGGKHFFIIDEINRGNLSRIFGELLVLTEATKRNESATLLYTKESFKVPDNVYIIGMMNTADRSLAMIDYALRRRFSFFPMEPAFGLESFKSYLDKIAAPKAKVLVAKIIELNNEIESDDNLGKGFKIGHSYLCAEDLSDESLKAIVQYEIIPLLEEYWYDEPSKVEKWSQELLSALK